jgi:hypothetical protein
MACLALAPGGLVWLGIQQVEAKTLEVNAMRDARILMIALKVYAAENQGKYPPNLETLVEQGLLTREAPLQTLVTGWVGKPGWRYYGADLGPADHFSKIILETRARDLDGRGVQVTNDHVARLVEIVDGAVK